MSKYLLAFIVVVIIIVAQTIALKSKTSDFYTAGVVEFRPEISNNLSGPVKLKYNLEAYRQIVNSAEAQATDIIVFPEGTLNNEETMTFVPDPQTLVIPCLTGKDEISQNELLVQLSCLARKAQKYLVINLTEKESCPASTLNDRRPCAPNGLNTYNTNVVFDREGRVISRYRKFHIYLEPRNRTLDPEYAIFETDFGVRFGHFICFDILFYTPAMDLVRRHDVQHFIFTSMFYSELPFLTAVQLQQSWAWANNVQLLAAGASQPLSGCTGSGIYAGRQGALNSLMASGEGQRRLLVARVPKNVELIEPEVSIEYNNAPQTELKFMKDYQLENYTTQLLEVERQKVTNISRKICNEAGFCCNFRIITEPLNISNVLHNTSSTNSNTYQYRLALFSGIRRYEQIEWSSLQICALIACTGEELSSCGEIFNDNKSIRPFFRFTTLEIEANFKHHEKLLLMPNSLDLGFYPLKPSLIRWKTLDKGSYETVQYGLREPRNDLLTFGIYANYFDFISDSSASSKLNMTYLVLGLFMDMLLFGWIIVTS